MPKVVVSDKKGLVQQSGSGFALTSADGTVWYLTVSNDGEALMLSQQPASGDEAVASGTKALISTDGAQA